MTIDLSRLPAPSVVEELSYEVILEALRDAFVAELPDYTEIDNENDPAAVLLRVAAYRELLLRQRINAAARATLLAFAAGADLDHVVVPLERLVLDEGDPDAVPPVPPTYETDDALRARALIAPEGYSVAGPVAAYEFHARSASAEVADVAVLSPDPCEITVVVLSTADDGVADTELLDLVEAAVNDRTVRPLGDRVTVQSASVTEYDVEAELTLYTYGPEEEVVLAAAEAALEAWAARNRLIGRDVPLSALYAALHVEGVQRVELLEPSADIVLGEDEAPVLGSITLTVVGRDE
jgi:phage-related baseplate assembly protein